MRLNLRGSLGLLLVTSAAGAKVSAEQGNPSLDSRHVDATKLPQCAGDCDKDSDCLGGLKCFQRNGLEPVPGCTGAGTSAWDYCYYEPSPNLNSIAGDPTNLPLAKCAGDCDNDSQCAGNLKCFQRDGLESVPGCAGGGTNQWDYCYDPWDALKLDSIAGDPTNLPLARCAGDCDKDSQCAGNLKCFQRDGLEPVPGCAGGGTRAWDYCYDPSFAWPNLDSIAGDPTKLPLARCAGDCDNDAQCAGNLKCFQRDGLELVPGCAGRGTNEWDYCYDPALQHGAGGVQIGSTVALWNPTFKYFLSNLADRKISAVSGTPKDVDMDFVSALFTVVDAGDGLIALHSQRYNCYLGIAFTGLVDCGGVNAPTGPTTTAPWDNNKFKVVPAGIGLVGLYSKLRKQYIRVDNVYKSVTGRSGSEDTVNADTAGGSCTWELLQVPQHLELGSLVGFWRSKNLLRMHADKMDSHAPLAEGRILDEWTWEQFEVVDAGAGQVALYNAAQGRFVKMTEAGTVSPGSAKSKTGGVTLEERFAVVPASEKTIALHNSNANRFLIINGPGQAPSGQTGYAQDGDSLGSSSNIWMKIVPISDLETTSQMPSCCACDHTKDKCRDMQVWMKSEPAGWIHQYWHRNWQVTSDPRGSKEVYWTCGRRRGGHERTGFNMPATHVDSYMNEGDLNYHPRYCSPRMYTPRESPKDRGCCSIADGTVDRCRSRQYLQMQVGTEWKTCYKGQTCEWTFPEPHPQGKTLHWWCGETKESVAWGLYFDTIQIKFNCNGEIEWNPWWCGVATSGEMPPEASSRLIDVLKINSDGDVVDGQTGASLSPGEITAKAKDFARDNKDVICEGLSAAAVYDQLLKPSGTCWRAGMTGRSSLFPGHSDYGTKTSLFEEGTRFTREERPHSSTLLALADHLAKNATLLQLSGNISNQELQKFLPGLMTAYCAVTKGTNCAEIGLEQCECYCVAPGRCTQVLAEKYAKSIAAILEMAADVAMAVMTGGASAAAKAGAKAAAKAALKAAAKNAAKGAGRSAIKKAMVTAAKGAAKKAAIASLKSQGKKSMRKMTVRAIKSGIKDTAKTLITDAIMDYLGLGDICKDILDKVLGEEVEDPAWVNDPEYKWGNEEGPAGYMETVDITGITALVGIFHEADCPTPVPGSKEGCPR